MIDRPRTTPSGVSTDRGPRLILAAVFFTALLGCSRSGEVAANEAAQEPPEASERTIEFELPGLEIGIAEYEEGPTGCTVLYFPDKAFGVVDLRGGAPGTINTDHLRTGAGVIDAICLAGGSAYGLEAATGVAAELLKRRDFSNHWLDIAVVPGAIIYDFPHRQNAIYADKALGIKALQSSRPGWFPLGPRGAGRSASVGEDRESSGQGAAFRQIGPTRIAVFTVVNALGGVVNRSGEVVRGNLDQKSGHRLSSAEVVDRRLAGEATPQRPGNTTLTVIVTNQRLGERELHQLARQVHSSMSRAIQPFHSLVDGDVLFGVTTREVDNPALNSIDLATIASELAWDAVLRAVSHEPASR